MWHYSFVCQTGVGLRCISSTQMFLTLMFLSPGEQLEQVQVASALSCTEHDCSPFSQQDRDVSFAYIAPVIDTLHHYRPQFNYNGDPSP